MYNFPCAITGMFQSSRPAWLRGPEFFRLWTFSIRPRST